MNARAYLVVSAAVAIAFMAGDCFGGSTSDDWKIRAETAEAAIPALTAHRDSARAVGDSLTVLVALQGSAYSTDSLMWARGRTRERRIAVQESRNLRTAADSLRSVVDSATAELVTEMETAHREAMRSKDLEIDALEHERASLWSQRETLADLVESLESENTANRAVIAQQYIALEAWKRAANPPLFERVLGGIPRYGLALSAGALLGYSLAGGAT